MRWGTSAFSASLAIAAIVLLVGCAQPGIGSTPAAGEVVVYTSVDQVFAEPVFEDFEAKTGIRVRAVYDAEAAKTTGLVNRLIAEKPRPRADVWWSGEIVQTLRLAERGVLAKYASPEASTIPTNLVDPQGRWTGFGGRARVILVNTKARSPVSPSSITGFEMGPSGPAHPASWDPRRTAMSSPVFGTASTQAAVLYALWGRTRAREYYARADRAGVRVLEGNGDVRDKVASGEFDWGLLDTDDALGAVEKGASVRIVVPDQQPGGFGAILIPNTVGVVDGAPNIGNARRLVDYLLSAETERRLVKERWIQFPVRGAPDSRIATGTVRFVPIDWARAYAELGPSATDMKELFLR